MAMGYGPPLFRGATHALDSTPNGAGDKSPALALGFRLWAMGEPVVRGATGFNATCSARVGRDHRGRG
jgi:hypothetical protein